MDVLSKPILEFVLIKFYCKPLGKIPNDIILIKKAMAFHLPIIISYQCRLGNDLETMETSSTIIMR